MDLDTICQKLLRKVVLKEPHPYQLGTPFGLHAEKITNWNGISTAVTAILWKVSLN